MGTVRDLAERLWTGEITTESANPLTTFLGLEDWGDGMAFLSSFANVTAFTTGEGLVLVDTGGHLAAAGVHAALRGWSKAPLHSAVYTHGHIDHVFGVGAFDREADAAGRARPRVLAHEAVAARFDRYKLTAGYNARINRRQFRVPGLQWPVDYRYPDVAYRDRLDVDVGGLRFELHHDRGETDDHTWVWVPAKRALCTGDLFIWASPNCGNPQKAQRYPREWAAALRKMAALRPEVLFPGHGPPISGADRVARALADSAELLERICEQTLALMNEGKRLDEVLGAVELPAELLARPYLRPVYDDPKFIIRNLWRLYGGWWDGNPARLEPPRDAALAGEVAGLAGGAAALAERAVALAERDLAAACQLAEWAWQSDPADARAAAVRADLYKRRAAAEPSLMAKSIYLAAAEESRK
jgi:glyoxylase-like metal-dependent hydrolase (beta-lactamase superfamily II)